MVRCKFSVEMTEVDKVSCSAFLVFSENVQIIFSEVVSLHL